MDKLTKLFMELLEPHVELQGPLEEPEWFDGENALRTRIFELTHKESFSRIEQNWDQFSDEITIARASEASYDQDRVEQVGVDVLAYYRTFRTINKGRPDQTWGIHFNLNEFFAFVRRIADSAGVAPKEALQPCFNFVMQHEINHYEVDLGIFFLETHSGQRGYHFRKTPVLLEEALGNARGVCHPKVKKFKAVITNRYARSGLPGYGDLKKYMTPKKQREAFNELLFDCIRPAKPVAPLGHEFMKPGAPFAASGIPIYFHITL